MIARNVTMRLKVNSVADFIQTLEKEVLPVLRKQRGFEDEITFIGPAGRAAVGIRLWDKQESADAYSGGGYPGALQAFANVLDGTPQVQAWDVCHSTVHNIDAAGAA